MPRLPRQFDPLGRTPYSPVHIKVVREPEHRPYQPGLQQRTIEQTRQQIGATPARFLAPIIGLTDHEFAEFDRTACILDNFMPTQTGIRPRPGTVKAIDKPGGTVNPATGMSILIPYDDGTRKRFLVGLGSVLYWYNLVGAGSRISAASLSSDALSGTTFSTESGVHVHIANGSNNVLYHAGVGNDFAAMTNSSTPALTGIMPTKLSYVWVYRNRLFFIEKNSTNAWYLPTTSIAGELTKLPLAGIFPIRSQLIFGFTMGLEAGNDLAERLVLVTDRGDCVVYGGTPGDQDFHLEGTYNIGVPLGPNCHFHYRDDVFIGTTTGLVSLATLIRSKSINAQGVYLSDNIRRTWIDAARLLPPGQYWRATVWNSRGYAFVYTGEHATNAFFYGVNLETGAWFRVTFKDHDDYDLRAVALGELDNKFYMLDATGNLHQLTGHHDNSQDIECVARMTPAKFPDNVGTVRIRTFWRGEPVLDKKTIASRIEDEIYPPGPPEPFDRGRASNQWADADGAGGAVWGTAEWGIDNEQFIESAGQLGATRFDHVWETCHRSIPQATLNMVAPTVEATMNYPAESESELVEIEIEVARAESYEAAGA